MTERSLYFSRRTFLFFFWQIGDQDEAENNTPDEVTEDLNRNKKSVVENSGTDEQQQVVDSWQPSLPPGLLFLFSFPLILFFFKWNKIQTTSNKKKICTPFHMIQTRLSLVLKQQKSWIVGGKMFDTELNFFSCNRVCLETKLKRRKKIRRREVKWQQKMERWKQFSLKMFYFVHTLITLFN